MTVDNYKRVVFSLAIGCLFLAGMFSLLREPAQIVSAAPGDLFVTPGGSGDCSQSSPCDLQSALGMATDGGTLYLAAGTYTGSGAAVVSVTQSITLAGGWDGAASGAVVCDPASHSTVLDAESARRGVYVNDALTVTLVGFTVTNGFDNLQGAGLYAQDAVLRLSHMTVYSNVVDGGSLVDYVYGGGAYVDGGSLHINDSAFRSNHCAAANFALYGGGLYVTGTLTTTVESTLFEGNSAWNCAGMWFGYGSLLVRQSRFQDNGFNTGFGTTSYAGGLLLESAAAHIEDSDFVHNRAGARGGAMDVRDSSFLLTGSVISGNLAPSSGLGVAGIYINGDSPFTLTNNIIVNNQPRNADSGSVHIVTNPGTSGYLSHNTIAGNTGSHGGTGVHASVDVTLINNILVSHTLGISVTAGYTATMDGTLWGSGIWANDSDWGGAGNIVTGSVNIWGDPDFVDPAGGDYHIGVNSAARDAGVDAGVSDDIDGEARPNGVGYDIGADEFVRLWEIYLPSLVKSSP